MNAKMSDRERRAGDFDSIFRDRSMLGRGEWTVEELWARDAEREARAILAESEPSEPWHPAIYGHGGSSERIACAVTEAEDALAVALRSFVEA